MTNPDNAGGLNAALGMLTAFLTDNSYPDGSDPMEDFDALFVSSRPLCRAAPAGGDDGAAEKWCICRSCMVIVRLPADTPLPGRCQCSPSSWSLTRLRIPKGYELRREASADVERCDSCDGTGLLHRADGMYVGECHCVYSAPAGSGEVEEFMAGIPRALELADRLIAAGPKAAHVSASETHEISEFVHEAAALLRKLQQGADYVVVPREALRVEARCLRYRATETCGLSPQTTDAGAQMVHTAEALEQFASQGQEGGNGNR